MKQTIRAFAVGLFTAALIMLVVNYFSNGSKQDLSEMPVEDVIEYVKGQGYRLLSEEEYISLSLNNKPSEEETDKASETEKNANEDESEENETESANNSEETSSNESVDTSSDDSEETELQEESVKTYTLTIESGMPSSSISNQLEENGIIGNASEFIAYLEDEGYANRIQLGEFTLTSDMSHFEIAEALTR